jgi:hypothetical protein
LKKHQVKKLDGRRVEEATEVTRSVQVAHEERTLEIEEEDIGGYELGRQEGKKDGLLEVV